MIGLLHRADRHPSHELEVDHPIADGEPVDGEPVDGSADDVQHVPTKNEETNKTKPFMRNCVVHSGTGHLIHNMEQDMHEHLDHWDRFFKMLKVLEWMLRDDERRRRYRATCLIGSYARYDDMFVKFSASLYDKRWKEVSNFIRVVNKLVPIMRMTFSLRLFLMGDSKIGQFLQKV